MCPETICGYKAENIVWSFTDKSCSSLLLSHRGLTYEAKTRVSLRKESIGQHVIPLKNYYRSPCKAFGIDEAEFYLQIKFLFSLTFIKFVLL